MYQHKRKTTGQTYRKGSRMVEAERKDSNQGRGWLSPPAASGTGKAVSASLDLRQDGLAQRRAVRPAARGLSGRWTRNLLVSVDGFMIPIVKYAH